MYHCIIDLLMHGVFAGRTQIDMKGQMGNWDAEFKVQTHNMVIKNHAMWRHDKHTIKEIPILYFAPYPRQG